MADEPELAIVERLRRKVQVLPAQGGGHIGIDKDGKTTSGSYITDDGKRLVNPNGPEAAAIIKDLVDTLRSIKGVGSLTRRRIDDALTRAGANNDPSK